MNTCSACLHPYNDIQGVKRCRLSGLMTELEAREMPASGCKTFVPAEIVRQRLVEACANPSIPRWRSLSQLCASIAMEVERVHPNSPLVDLIVAMAKEAHGRSLAMHPKEE